MSHRPAGWISPRRTKLASGLALAAVALLGSLVTTASAGATKGAATSSQLVVNMPVAPATLDPASACGVYDFTIMENTYARLTRYGSKPGPNGTTAVDPGKIVPYFATSWKVTNDGKRYTFKLRPEREVPERQADGREGGQVLLRALA